MKPTALTVIVNPYAKRLSWRVADVQPRAEHPASSIPLRDEVAVKLLYWPHGRPFDLEVFAFPKRLNSDRSGVEKETRSFVVISRRAARPGDFNHLDNWRESSRVGFRRRERA